MNGRPYHNENNVGKLWNTTNKADLEVDLNLPVSRSSPVVEEVLNLST